MAGHFGERSCAKCREQPDLKVAWQCEGGEGGFIIPLTPPIAIERCPMFYLGKDIETAFFLYGHYKDGRLPIAGGVLDQIHTGLESFRLIDEYMETAGRK